MLATSEHADLEPWAIRADRVDVRRGRGLNHPVDVDRLPPGVRPLAGVDLLGRDQTIDDLGAALQERPELGGLRGGQFGDTRHMPTGLDELEENLRSIANRIGAAIIIAALLIASAMLVPVHTFRWLGIVGFCLAGVLGLYMVWKIIRTPGEL